MIITSSSISPLKLNELRHPVEVKMPYHLAFVPTGKPAGLPWLILIGACGPERNEARSKIKSE
jgi:hypothetical protein